MLLFSRTQSQQTRFRAKNEREGEPSAAKLHEQNDTNRKGCLTASPCSRGGGGVGVGGGATKQCGKIHELTFQSSSEGVPNRNSAHTRH